MNFLVLLLVPLVEKLTRLRQWVQRDGWWHDLRRRHERPGHPWRGLAWLVLLPLVLVWLLLEVLEPLFYGWVAVLLHLWLLLYSLGRGEPGREMAAFRQAWRRGDGEAAGLAARRDMQLDASSELDLFEQAQSRVLWQGYQGFFAVIFWYVLLGPLAALAYRLLDVTERYAEAADLRGRAGCLRPALDWLPVRVLAASLALVGNFERVSQALKPSLLRWQPSARQLLSEISSVSAEPLQPIRGEPGLARLDALRALLLRAGLLWYAVLALWTFID